MRNPIGPLPSSIYWRRRAVALSLLALIALLVFWAVNSGGGGGKGGQGGGPNGKGPVTSITPGPTSSGPAISQHPGGRDVSGGSGDGGGDGSGGADGGDGGTDAGSEGGDGSAGGADGGTAGDGSGGSGSGGGGNEVPAGSTLPNCTSGFVDLKLRSVKNTYGPDDKPTFELVAKNTGGTCKVDFGPKSAVLTITEADSDKQVWSSEDCPKDAKSVLLQVPGKGDMTHTVDWNRKPSAPHCATPPAGAVKAGTYLVEAKAAGLPAVRTSFVLEKD